MAIQIQLRRDTSANWQAINPILSEGELGLDLTTKLIKTGDGVNRWNDLPPSYIPDAPIDGNAYVRQNGEWVKLNWSVE